MHYFGAFVSICTILVRFWVQSSGRTALFFVVVHRFFQPERTAVFIQKTLSDPEPGFGRDDPLREFNQFFLALQSSVERGATLLKGDANIVHKSGAAA